MKKRATSKATETPAYRFAGDPHGVHTRLPIVVRNVEFEATPNGRMVLVSATMGESEANTEIVKFPLTEREAIAADILDRVCHHCGGSDIRMVSVPGIETAAGVCFDCRKEWRA